MEHVDFKPLGSVVTLNGTSRKLMIVARALTIKTQKGETVFFDYGAVLYPEGLFDRHLFYFQDKDIDFVVFTGFSNSDDTVFLEKVDAKVRASTLKRADTVKLNQTSNNKEYKKI